MSDNRREEKERERREYTPEEIEAIRRRRKKARLERERRIRRQRRILLGVLSVIVVALIIVVVVVFAGKGKSKKSVSAENKSALKTTTQTDVKAADSENTVPAGAKITPGATIAPTISVTPTPTLTPTPEPTPIVDDGTGTTINVCMVGDLLLAASVMESCRTGETTYDFNPLFEYIAPRVQCYDLAIIDEETACGGLEYGVSGYPSFNSPHEAQDAIANAGFNVALLATNHMLDFGTGPLISTLQYWRENLPQVTPIGAYDTPEAASQIYVYEKEGFRVSVLNYTYGTNAGTGDDYGMPWAVNILEEDKVYQDIMTAKTMSDYVIVCPHWGTEYNNDIDDYQRYWTGLFSAWGVDLILGNHPHTVEPIEEIVNEEGHKMVVYYSVGNCISNCAFPNSIVGGMAHIALRKNASGVHVDDYGVIPLANHLGGTWFRSIPLADYNDELAFTNSVHDTYPELSHQLMLDIAYSVFGADKIRY